MKRPVSPSGNLAPSRTRAVLFLAATALLALAGEVAWFSAPVQEWRLGRLELSALERHVAASPYDTRTLYHYALRLREAGRDTEAADVLHRAVIMEPHSHRLLVAMGETMLRLGRLERAEEYLGQAVHLGETSPRARAALATVHQRQERWAQAAAAWRAVVRQRPDDAAAWHALGECEARLLRPEEWREAMERAARLEPRNAAYQRDLGEALAYQEAWEEAERVLGEALRLDPSDARARYRLADARGRRATSPQEEARVVAEFRRAAAALPDDPELPLLFGRFLAARGRWAEAAQQFEIALRLDPTREQAHYQRALAYRRLGRAADADRALALFKRLSDARRTVAYLGSRVELASDDPDLRRRLSHARDTLARIVVAAKTEVARIPKKDPEVRRRGGH